MGIDAANWDPAITLIGDAAIFARNTGTEIDQTINLNANTLSIQGERNIEYSGVISGTGAITVDMWAADDVVTLSAANTYSGTTDVNVGILTVNAVQNPACSGLVTVANAATLSGTGTIQGIVAVQSGGIVRPAGAATGTLTTATDVIFQGTSQFIVNNAGGSFDVLAVGGNLTLPAGTALISLEAGQSYTTSNAVVTIAGTYNAANEFSTASLPPGWGINSVANTSISLTYSGGGAIPTLNEWGMIIAMLLLAGTAVLVMRKRRTGAHIA